MKSDSRDTPRDGEEQHIMVQSEEQLPESAPHEPVPKIFKNKLPSVFIPTKKKHPVTEVRREERPERGAELQPL